MADHQKKIKIKSQSLSQRETMSKLPALMICLLSLMGCAKNGAGDFCAAYVVVDMPGSEAAKLERQYQERILANELWHFNRCER